MLISARQGGTHTSAFFELILLHECQHSLNEKGTKNCHSVPTLFFIPTYVYTRMLVYTHTRTLMPTPCLLPALPCPALGVREFQLWNPAPPAP